jgi:hypothetical protein
LGANLWKVALKQRFARRSDKRGAKLIDERHC